MTNLIEQLGGYDVVKKMWIDGGSLKDTQLAFELLEHRRQHNIFEVGDGVSHPIFSSIFTIDKVQSYSVLATTNTGYHTSLKTELIRHATDKEIAQGYRDE